MTSASNLYDWSLPTSSPKRLARYIVLATLVLGFFVVWRGSLSNSLATSSRSLSGSLSSHPALDANSRDIEVSEPLGELNDAKIYSRIAKVTAVYYDEVSVSTQAYELALASHLSHDRAFGYRHFVQRRDMNGAWGKLSYLLSVLTTEMDKPADERLDWLFWHDADLVLINRNIPLDIFLPPEPEWSHVNFICSNDLAGLNAGVFFLRVSDWSVQLMAAALSYAIFKPDVGLRYAEQTTLMLLSREVERFKEGTMHVPQRWFNAYHHFGTDDTIPPEWKWEMGYIEPGDMLVHLPGTGGFRSDIIKEWVQKVRDDPETWVLALEDTDYVEEIQRFWAEDAKDEFETQDVFWRRWHVIQDVGGDIDRWKDDNIKDIEDKYDQGTIDESEKTDAIKAIESTHRNRKIEGMRKLYAARVDGSEQDNVEAL